ncbi:nuclear transport factor 2 family protein [Runella salmonicolor]|jgi:ketosteroid isomerase-like protein|uniref:Nuclear transport factor 2 family protein n=1 Tax=Runella salmonicolor TaxID=2950278 RepID=A0ABT1FQD2_9BACT|nr:nuclear transport factor 2 family protein [Runella salmonicolor]MCP1383705.1 nuclear transport factor 2 family protein [Runella salmonicolor]
MKNLSRFTLIGAILLLWVFKSYVALSQTSKETLVADIEKKRFAALVSKDYAYLNQVMGEDIVYCHSSGLIDTKASFIQSMKDGKLVYNEMTPDELKVRIYDKTAVITGVCTAKVVSNGQQLNTRFRFTDVYVKRKEGWQMVTWQSLRLP